MEFGSWYENRCAIGPAGAQIGERLVGLFERIERGFGDDADLRRQPQEIESILPCKVGNRYKLPLFPKQIIRETGISLMWIPAQTTRPPLRAAFSATGTRSPAVTKMMAASSSSDGISSDPPAQVVPRLRANACVMTSPGRVKANTDRPCHFAICARIWAAAPKP